MLLRPRKNIFKSAHKKRSYRTTTKDNFFKKSNTPPFTARKLVYGQFGLSNQNPNFLLYNKYLFKIKLFLKKTVRRSNITGRHLWVKIFPHIPLTKKVIGSRMGKGKGKPTNWAAKVPHYCIFIELRNVRVGRITYFINQVVYKLPGEYKLVSRYAQNSQPIVFKKHANKYDYFY